MKIFFEKEHYMIRTICTFAKSGFPRKILNTYECFLNFTLFQLKFFFTLMLKLYKILITIFKNVLNMYRKL